MTQFPEPNLSPAERATLKLRGLYEQFGYKKYQVSQFEEYSLYMRFQSFLTGGRILSFTDLDGRLLALKPDVTLSIAKNVQLADGPEKAYYIENVYRESLSSGTMKEINQMGVEYIGGDSAYAQAEALYLARETLAAIGPAYVLEISHMGFMLGLFDALGLTEETRAEVMHSLSSKSAHGVEATLRSAGVGAAGITVLTELCHLSGAFEPTLEKARGLCLNGRMTAALDELSTTVHAIGLTGSIRLDFTLQGDMEYYDGLMIAGYLDGVPTPVLSGGRYDGLMKKLGRDVPAVGFALYLDDLKRLPREKTASDNEMILVADADTDTEALLRTVIYLTAQGQHVRVVHEMPPKANSAKIMRFGKDGVTEC